MSIRGIEKLLRKALLQDGKMDYALYEFELEEHLGEMKVSMVRDKEDYIFTVTVNRGHVAMVLVERSGEVYVNEEARERLKVLWPAGYKRNMEALIPGFALQLHRGELSLVGVEQEGWGDSVG